MDKQLKEAIDDVGTAFEAYKETNDKRLEAVEKGASTDEIDVKLEKLDADVMKFSKIKEGIDTALKDQQAANDNTVKELQEEIGELAKKLAHSPAANDGRTEDQVEHEKQFNKYLRKGSERNPELGEILAELEKKNLGTDVDPDGGYAVPELLDRALIEIERQMNPMRMVAGQITVGTPDYKALVNLGGAESGWVGERDPRPETQTPKLEQIQASMGELYANPAATQTSLDDIFFDVEAWLANQLAIAFAEKENAAFTSGDGTNKPKGLLAYATDAASDFGAGARPFETFQHLVQGDAAVGGDDLIDLIHQLRVGYRSNAKWMMNNLTVPAIRKIKTNDGQYMWEPGLKEGQPNRLLSYELVENEDMPIVGTGANAVALGDFKRGYLIVDRIGTRTLRDPFTNKPYVHFYTTKRVGGMALDSLAIKFLQAA